MAILGATSLTNCDSIPSFIGSGSKMIFRMSTVPVSWTKDTTPNEAMCRITNSTVSPGGSISFTSVFQSNKSLSGITSTTQISATVNPASNTAQMLITGLLSPANQYSLFPATMSIAQISSHTHGYQGSSSPTQLFPRATGTLNYGVFFGTPGLTLASGQGGAHTHTAQYTPHSHTITGGPGSTHTHTLSGSSLHSHPVTGSDNFALAYIDIVIATKN
jgi:hypothetical protein